LAVIVLKHGGINRLRTRVISEVLSISGFPMASLNGPSGLSPTATPIFVRSTGRKR
jgi:hypothetical protein